MRTILRFKIFYILIKSSFEINLKDSEHTIIVRSIINFLFWDALTNEPLLKKTLSYLDIQQLF